MSIEWFQLNDIIWEGLDLRFTRFHFSIARNAHPTAPNLWLLGICSPEYENTCVPLGTYRDLEIAKDSAAKVSEIVFQTALKDD
jgi:hypothetical protein